MAEIRTKYIGNSALRRQPLSREEYNLSSLERAFPAGNWVDPPQDGGGGVPAPENGSGGRTEASENYITVIGSQKYEQDGFGDELAYAIEELKTIVVGDGRGAESHIVKTFFDGVVHIPVNPDRYGKSARKVNVEEVLCYAIDSPLLLVGNGERVKQARAWLERTKSQREVVELP